VYYFFMFYLKQNDDYRRAFNDVFGEDFINLSINEFFRQRNRISTRDTYSVEIPIVELKLHPIIKDVLRVFKPKQELFDQSLLPDHCKADSELMLLGRDLHILRNELLENPEIFAEYQRELVNPLSYRARRFELMVAAGYKIQGYAIHFLARESAKSKKTYEFSANTPTGVNIQVECKQRNQALVDSVAVNYLSLLMKRLAPVFCDGCHKLIVSTDPKSINLSQVNDLAELITSHINGKTYFQKIVTEIGDIEIKDYAKHQIQNSLFAELDRPDPTYTTTEDEYIFCHKGFYLMVKRSLGDGILKIYDRLFSDAKKKFSSNDVCRLVYFDIGDLPIDELDRISLAIQTNPIPSIEGVFLLKSILHLVPSGMGQSAITFSPATKAYLKKSKMYEGILPENAFGLQGETGFDNYIQLVL
jgi:hypothetical protein